MTPRALALTAALLPLTALVSAYLWSASAGHVEWCMPLLEGCTSISRAARRGDTVYLFRLLMMPYGMVLIFFWIYTERWLVSLGDPHPRLSKWMMWSGIIAACMLLIYVDFLATDGKFYRALRRYGVIFYFSLTGLAEMILVSRLYKLGGAEIAKCRKALFGICLAMIAFALANAVVGMLPGEWDAVYNIIEWNFAILMHLFFLGIWWSWKKTDFSMRFSARLC